MDRTVTVKVTDADEPGEVKLPQNAEVGVELTAVLTDSDGGAPNSAQFIDQVWTWYSLAAGGRNSPAQCRRGKLQWYRGRDLSFLHSYP